MDTSAQSEGPGAPPVAAPGPKAYRDANVLRWLIAYTASILGDSLYFLSLAWAAAQAGRPADVGFVLAVGAVPRAVFMLFGGVIADRLGPRRVVLTSDTVRATVVLAVALTLFLASPGLWILIALALVFGLVDALFMPAVGALPPLITAPSELARVQGLRSLGQRVGTIVGPSAGGLAVAVGGPAGAFAAAGLVFAVSVVLLLMVRVRPAAAPASDAPSRSPWQDLVDGLHYVRRHRLLVPLIAVTGLGELGLSGPLNIGMVLLSHQRGWGPSGLGLITGAFGAGAAAGSILLAVRGRLPRAGLLCGWSLLLAGAAVAFLGAAHRLGWALVAGLLIGLAAGLTGSAFAALLQTVTDPAYLGRVTAVVTLLSVGVVPLCYPATGAAIGAWGLFPVFAGFGAIAALAAAIVALTPSLRTAGTSDGSAAPAD
jgi:MFS family permease